MRHPITRRLPRRLAATLACAVAVLALTGATVATAASTPQVVTAHSGTSTTRTAIETQSDAATYTGGAYVNVGTPLGIYGLAGQWITTTFTAESACYGTAGAWCSIRILVDGVEAEPVVGTDYAFNSVTGSGSTGWSGHTVTRTKVLAAAGTHSVQVQAVQVGSATHRLDDWTLWGQITTP